MWRYLTPATAPREDGLLEFHVRAVDGGWVSRSLVTTAEPGDKWRMGRRWAGCGWTATAAATCS